MNSDTKKVGWFKANKTLFLMFVSGAVLLLASLVIKNNVRDEIPAMVRLMSYLSCLCAFLAVYIYFVKRKSVIISNILLIFVLLLIVEIGCFFLLGMPAAVKKNFNLPDLPEDHITRSTGSLPYADSVHRMVKIFEGDTLFDAHATIDKNCMRVTPDHDSTRKDFALFFGCSIAFGEGLEDNQTLAYSFQQETGKNAYNFAVSGHGTNNVLARLQYKNISDLVAEKNGVGFYIFFWDHIYRGIGSMARYTAWTNNEPYFTMEDGKLVRRKMFKDGRKNISRAYEYLYQSNIVKYFEMDLPLRLNESHFDLISEMVLESKKKYKQQFGNDDFYMVIYPAYKVYTEDQMKQFKAMLKKKGVKCIDLSDFIEYSPKHTLNGDAHPNAETNLLVAKELKKRIESKKFD